MIDWRRLEVLATRTAMLEVLDETLGYVAREFALPVPTAVLGRLHGHPRSPLAARELALRIRRPGVLGFVPLALLRHARRARRSESVAAARGRIAYLVDCVGERSLGSALATAVRKALWRVWRMTHGRA